MKSSTFVKATRPAPPERTPDHPGLGARLLAAKAVKAAVEQHVPLGDWLESSDAEALTFKLDSRDIALGRSIAIVTLRHFGSLRKSIAHFLDRGLPRKSGPLEANLLTGAAQILYMDVPDHAAVDLTVRLCRLDRNANAFTGLANAVLRNIIRGRDTLGKIDPLADETPQWLAKSWIRAYGEPAAQAIAAAHMEEPTLDLTVKSDAEGWAATLGGIVLPNGSVRLERHESIPDLPGYADGGWWVQDAAASLPARLLHARAGELIADLCAAPGGKTAQLAATGAKVVAIDRSGHRLKRVKENLARLQLSAEIRTADVLDMKAEPVYDAILLDAPCSATGTIRRHPDVAWTKQPQDITALAEIQSKMLDKAVAMLKPGGRLVYCVCSLQPEEGPEQVRKFLARHSNIVRDVIRADETGFAETITPEGDMRSLPQYLSGSNPRLSGLDGFFAARFMYKQSV